MQTISIEDAGDVAIVTVDNSYNSRRLTLRKTSELHAKMTALMGELWLLDDVLNPNSVIDS